MAEGQVERGFEQDRGRPDVEGSLAADGQVKVQTVRAQARQCGGLFQEDHTLTLERQRSTDVGADRAGAEDQDVKGFRVRTCAGIHAQPSFHWGWSLKFHIRQTCLAGS